MQSTCRFLYRYYCGTPPSTSSIILDTLRLTLYLAICFAIAYGTVYTIAYLERRKVLRELWRRKGVERHGVLMGMFERMGWRGDEVEEWRRGEVELRDWRERA